MSTTSCGSSIIYKIRYVLSGALYCSSFVIWSLLLWLQAEWSASSEAAKLCSDWSGHIRPPNLKDWNDLNGNNRVQPTESDVVGSPHEAGDRKWWGGCPSEPSPSHKPQGPDSSFKRHIYYIHTHLMWNDQCQNFLQKENKNTLHEMKMEHLWWWIFSSTEQQLAGDLETIPPMRIIRSFTSSQIETHHKTEKKRRCLLMAAVQRWVFMDFKAISEPHALLHIVHGALHFFFPGCSPHDEATETRIGFHYKDRTWFGNAGGAET